MAAGLASAGADVLLTSRHEDEAVATAEQIQNDFGHKAVGIKADVAAEEEVQGMVDRALSEFGKTVVKHGVNIIGPANLPASIATDASALFARNLLNFITPVVDKETGALKIDTDDEIIKGTLVTQGGRVVHPQLAQA